MVPTLESVQLTFCPTCQAEFAQLAVHRKVVHEGEKEFRCAFCGRPFVGSDDLIEHISQHEDAGEQRCCVCDEAQSSDERLSAHLESHRELHIFACPSCPATFAFKAALAAHSCSSSQPRRTSSDPNFPSPQSTRGEDDLGLPQRSLRGYVTVRKRPQNATAPSVTTDELLGSTDSILGRDSPDSTQQSSLTAYKRPQLAVDWVDTSRRPLKRPLVLSDSSSSSDQSDVTPMLSRKSRRKGKSVRFNEMAEWWNPTREETAWLPIVEETPETREVPLLGAPPPPPPKRVRQKKTQLDKAELDVSAATVKLTATDSVDTSKKVRKKATKKRNMPVRHNKKELYEQFGDGFHFEQCMRDDGRYYCPAKGCPLQSKRGYANVKILRNHIRVKHIDVDCLQCATCDKKFPIKSQLVDHLKSHWELNRYVCYCGKTFKNDLTLNAHQVTHTKSWECYHCKRSFSRKNSLASHIVAMSCKPCGTAYHCVELFMRHEAARPHKYACGLCGSVYSTRIRIHWHLRNAHYNSTTALVGQFHCSICDRRFSNAHNARRHVRRNHVESTLEALSPDSSKTASH